MACRSAPTIAGGGEKVKGKGGNSPSTVGKVLDLQGLAAPGLDRFAGAVIRAGQVVALAPLGVLAFGLTSLG